jgi:hypothetical protein
MEDTEYIEYSLENTVQILEARSRYRSNIFVVRANRMNNSLSEWEAMLLPGYGLRHLAALFENCLEQLHKRTTKKRDTNLNTSHSFLLSNLCENE